MRINWRAMWLAWLGLSLLATAPAAAQGTQADEAWAQSVTNDGNFGAPRKTTASRPVCRAGNVSGLVWNTTGTKLQVCNGTSYLDIATGSGSGASAALDNLASVNINTSLLAQTGVDLGSTTKPFRNAFFFGGGTYGTTYFELTGTPTGTRVATFPDANTSVPIAAQTLTFAGPTAARTITFPDAAITVARTDAANTFTGHQTIEGVTSTGATGTGAFVFATTPTLVTPVLGAATGTSIALGGATLGANAFAVTGHLLLEGVTSTGASGTGALIFGTSPTITTPTISARASAAGVALSSTTTAAAQTVSTTAGLGMTLTADPAVAGSTNAGAAKGGNITLTAGAAAQKTSGNANGGDINLVTGAAVGTGTAGQVLFPDGTAAVPGLAFTSDPDTGIYHAATNNIGFAINGTNAFNCGTSDCTFAADVRSSGNNTKDVGQAGDAWRSIYFATSLIQYISATSKVVISGTAPTIASGGCTSPAVTSNNGTGAFLITIGSSCTGVKTVVLTMPAANSLWACTGNNNTSSAQQDANTLGFRATSTTAVTITNYSRTTGLQADYTASDTLLVHCTGD